MFEVEKKIFEKMEHSITKGLLIFAAWAIRQVLACLYQHYLPHLVWLYQYYLLPYLQPCLHHLQHYIDYIPEDTWRWLGVFALLTPAIVLLWSIFYEWCQDIYNWCRR